MRVFCYAFWGKKDWAKAINKGNQMQKSIINFEQVDSWFFRESRPFGGVGASRLSSVFPPPTRTLMGAIRHHIGTQYFAKNPNVNWDNLNELKDLAQVIGNEHHLGNVRPCGIFLQKNSGNQAKYYLPAPVSICQKSDNDKVAYLALQLSEKSYQTDIGLVHLPSLPDDARGAKPLENYWISTNVWQNILNGDLKSLSALNDEVCQLDDFISKDHRLGIELETDNRGVKDGQLYQTIHLRLQPQLSIAMAITYDKNSLDVIDNQFLQIPTLLRLGGEGRMASVLNSERIDYLPKAPKDFTQTQGDKKRFMLYLVSKLSMTNQWLPQGFTQNDSETGFIGSINGLDMTIICACIGKAHREGGWNQLEHKPKVIDNYLPVGTVFFVEVSKTVPDNEIVAKLHGQVFNQNEWGEGLMLVGKVVA